MSDKDALEDSKIIKKALADQNNIKPNKSNHFYSRHYVIHQTDFLKILQLALKSVAPSPSQPPSDSPPLSPPPPKPKESDTYLAKGGAATLICSSNQTKK